MLTQNQQWASVTFNRVLIDVSVCNHLNLIDKQKKRKMTEADMDFGGSDDEQQHDNNNAG